MLQNPERQCARGVRLSASVRIIFIIYLILVKLNLFNFEWFDI